MIALSDIIWVQDIQNQPVGGKAQGLQQLLCRGLKVPLAFVIIHAEVGKPMPELATFYQQLGGGKVAVRSSAIGEDGEESSFAGQYETVLNVEGLVALRQAIDVCVQSLRNSRASAYRREQGIDAGQMSIVVQQMVEVDSAGVLFTVDPVSGRYDRLVIDAVAGLGEALVNGEQTPDHYEFDLTGEMVYSELLGDQAVVAPAQLAQLMAEARSAAEQAGHALDMEWAIDKHGKVFWLQARPITTIGADLNELDTPVAATDVLTRCNIGEMMPGACCPLTFSTTGRAIEEGMQAMHVSYAGRLGVTSDWTQVAVSHGQLFLNLTGSAAAAATVLGVDVKSLGHSVCGGIVEQLKEPPKRSWWVRANGSIQLLNYLKNADAVITEFTRRAQNFRLPVVGNSAELVTALETAQPFLSETMAVHLQSSTTSGFASNILQAIISGGQDSSPEEEARAASLMAGASGVESAVLVEQLDHIVDLIAGHEQGVQHFQNANAADALAWLTSTEAGPIQQYFQGFIERHGHRGYRELCMREVSWADAPEGLIATMQTSLKARESGVKISAKPDLVALENLSRALRWILPKAHNAVRRRESTKSLLVDITNRYKQSYRALGHQLLAEGKVDDADLVFFFTFDELKNYVHDVSSEKANIEYWNVVAQKRRTALNYQNRLQFDDVCVGNPQPIDRRSLASESSAEIIGRPVSLGVVEARARVAMSVAEASQLQPGEILVAPITDVGWTPYFSMISGLITDVGSAVSHGAVIAREYGLPAIVNTRVGTTQIKTGDKVRLDANTGVVNIL